MGLLDAGPILAARLRDKCPAAGDNVFSAADLANVQERSQVTPALHLVLQGYKPVSNDGFGETRWLETWLVVVVVRNARQNVGTQAVRDDATTLLAESVAALDGWRLPESGGMVRAVAPPAPMITDGFGYFPMAFSVPVVTLGCEDQ